MDSTIRDLIFQTIDQTISPEDFERIQDAIEHDESVRVEYLRAVNLCESLSDIAREPTALAAGASTETIAPSVPAASAVGSRLHDRVRAGRRYAMLAAATLVLVSGSAYWLGQHNGGSDRDIATNIDQDSAAVETLIAGHATLRRSVDLQWANGQPSFREGDVLPDGLLKFDEGVAEIDFFCGATLIVEGPAALDVESDWSVRVIEGRLRANVPPAARGFVVKAAGSEIVDLGTEFALEVSTDRARVEVIDGEVEIRGGEHDGNHLVTGQRTALKGTNGPADFAGLSTLNGLKQRQQNAESQRFADWQQHASVLATDERLIAYYPIAAAQTERKVLNTASTGVAFNGTLVGPVERTTGRFSSESAGLEFSRTGSRVRTRIDGEFKAFTFACWVRIDSLEHVYNALFMSDGYETGELHWQIRNDGRLMFSVMVDDTQSVQTFSEMEQREVETAGLARVYYSEPIWDISKSGQWFHVAAVYDPATRRVVQYANGKQVGSQEIIDRFHIDTLRIGAAEIGNWGQPFRKTPWFSVRNLNGTIDELAIFDAALTSEEVSALFQNGKPLGY